MAQRSLLVKRKFSKCLPQRREEEVRIIAEALIASWDRQYFAVRLAAKNLQEKAVFRGSNYTNVLSSEWSAPKALQLRYQSKIVFIVGRVSVRHGAIPQQGRVAS